MARTSPPSGTRDFLSDELRRRRRVIEVIQSIYESFGFEPLETPAFENLSTLLGKYGEEGDQLLFRILLRGEKLQQVAATPHPNQNQLSDLALKYDLTVPLARVVARLGSQLPKFYKRYQIQPVWRADRPAKGRYREFMQCDLDVCGSASLTVEAEILTAACMIYDRLGFKDYAFQINHRQLLRGLVDSAGIPADQESTALVAVDKIDKIGLEGVSRELTKRGIADSSTEALLNALDRTSRWEGNAEMLDLLRNLLDQPAAQQGLHDLQTILDLTRNTVAGPRLRVQPSLARGLSYYTGAIFEAVSPAGVGSLGGGGRYDELIGMFSAKPIPACGYSLGLDRIVLTMEQLGLFEDTQSAVTILFVHFPDTLPEILELAGRIRQLGVACDVYPETAGLKQQFHYAASRKTRYVAFFGTREKESRQLRLKRQTDGVEWALSIGSLESELQDKQIL